MNAPQTFPAISSGWNDATLASAYRLLEGVYERFGPNCESDAASAVYAAMEAVEAADCAVSQ